jgi:hypothetical protein
MVTHIQDPLETAHGVLHVEVLTDPNQPRVRGLRIETAGGGIFTLALDARTAMGLATACISAALAIEPALGDKFVERVDRTQE